MTSSVTSAVRFYLISFFECKKKPPDLSATFFSFSSPFIRDSIHRVTQTLAHTYTHTVHSFIRVKYPVVFFTVKVLEFVTEIPLTLK